MTGTDDVTPERKREIEVRARQLLGREISALLNFWDPQDFHADVLAYTEEERSIFDAEVMQVMGKIKKMTSTERGSRG